MKADFKADGADGVLQAVTRADLGRIALRSFDNLTKLDGYDK